MSLESTLICLDNSEWMRNGDYTPNRLGAQNDAVLLLADAKTQANQESTVGIMTYAGKRPEVLVTPTSSQGKILKAVHGIKTLGELHFSEGLQIGQLALKHRQNKNGRQRLIVFVGSPIMEDEKSLVRLAKKLKKNNVAVDIINFGEEAENTSKLEAFIAAVNSSDNSRLVTVPPGPHVLSDILFSSPIINENNANPNAPSFGGSSAFEYGVDPNVDPELALALRISMEEERARQEKLSEQNKQDGQSEQQPSSSQQNQDVVMGDEKGIRLGRDIEVDLEALEDFDEQAMLDQALRMSMGEALEEDYDQDEDDENMEDLTEEEQIQRALALSQMGEGQEIEDILQDPALMSSLIGGLPGVDSNDPRMKELLDELAEKEQKEKEKKNKKDEK